MLRDHLLLGPDEEASCYKGHLDCVSGGFLKGWMWRVGDISALEIDVLIDGEIIERVVALEYRSDLHRFGIGGGRHAFQWRIPTDYFDNRAHTFEIESADDHWRLPQVLTETLVFGELSLKGARHVSGWFRASGEAATELRLFVDGILAAQSLRVGKAGIAGGVDANTFEFPLPYRWLDNREHEIYAEVVVNSHVRTLGPIRATLHAAQDSTLSGQVTGLKAGSIEGKLSANAAIVGVEEVALLVDGVEEVRAVPRDDGSFYLPLATLPVLEWLRSELEVVCTPVNVALPYDGQHIVADALSVKLEEISGEHLVGSLHSEFALSQDLDLEARTGGEIIGRVRIAATNGRGAAAFRLPCSQSELTVADVSFLINGVSVQTDLPAAVPLAAQPEPVFRPRKPTSFVPPNDPSVARRLQELALGSAQPHGDIEAPAITGTWHFSPPDRVEGWALDIASPSDPLAVTLYVDGRPIESRPAREMMQPAETPICVQVPVGFTFILPLLPRVRCEIDVRPQGGGSLAPHKPRTIRLDAREPSTSTFAEAVNQARTEIDHYVAVGQLVEAYLIAKRHAAGASIAARYALLDFALRTEWHKYRDTLAAFEQERRSRPLVEFLRSAFVARGEAAANLALPPFALLKAGLSAEYLPLLRTKNIEPNSDDLLERIEKSLTWRALTAAADHAAFCPAEETAALLYVLERSVLEELFLRHLTAAAAKGIAVVLVLEERGALGDVIAPLTAGGVQIVIGGGREPRAVATDVLAAVGGREFLVANRRPAIYGTGALGLWPAVIGSRRPLLTVAEICQPADLALVGRAPDSNAALLRRPTAESLVRFLAHEKQNTEANPAADRDVEITAYVVQRRIAPEPVLIVLHDFDSEERLPALPAGAISFRVRDRQVMTRDRELLLTEFADRAKEEHGASDQTPVALLSSELEYPPDYVRECLRLTRLHRGGMRLSFLPLDYEDGARGFTAGVTAVPSLRFFALAPTCCFFLADIASLEGDSMADHVVIVRHEQPFLAVPLLGKTETARKRIDAVLAKLNRSVAARQMGFVGAALSARAGIASPVPISAVRVTAREVQEKLAAITRADIVVANPGVGELTIDDVNRLLSLNRRELAEAAVVSSVGTAEGIALASREKIETVLAAAKILGSQQNVGAQLRPHAEALVSRLPAVVTPLFECLAATLPEGDFTAALFSCVPTLATGRNAKDAYRVAELCRKYCSPGALLTLLFLIDSSRNNHLLFETEFASLVGDALSAGDSAPFTLPKTRLDQQFFLEAAPLERRLVQAVIAGDRAGFIRLCDRLLLRDGDRSEAVLRTLRVYTSELAELQVVLSELRHSAVLGARKQLMLAAMLADTTHISDALRTADRSADDAVIVAATCMGEYRPLERAYKRWAGEAGVTPVRFSGSSIESMFENFATARTFAPASESPAKVSVIMTVYNPDLELLRLAITSVVQQTYSNFEVVLIDDASDQIESNAIETLVALDERISFLRMPRNQGPYVCRNRALELCTGDYVAIQDGDDYSHPERFERQVATLASSEILQLCTTSHIRIDRNACLQFEHNLRIRGDGTMSSLFRRSLIERIGPFAAVRSRGDVEFRERVRTSHGSHAIAHIECPLLFCYATPQSLSNRTARSFTHFLSLFRESFQVLRGDPVIPWEKYAPPRPVRPPWPLQP